MMSRIGGIWSASTYKAAPRFEAAGTTGDRLTIEASYESSVARELHPYYSLPRERLLQAIGALDTEDREAKDWAEVLVSLLPEMALTPRVFVDPDGEVAFQWRGTGDDILLLSVASNGEVHFALLTQTSDYRGRSHLDAGIPRSIVAAVEEIIEGAPRANVG